MGISKAKLAEREKLAAQGLKRCTKCKDVKEHSEFNKNKAMWDRLRSYCRICQSDKGAAHYKDNREKVLERHQQYRGANREQIREYRQEYYAANREQLLEYGRKYDHARRASDPLWGRIHKGAARARKLGCEVIPFNSKDLLSYWEVNNISSENCYYCNSEFNGFFHLDHKIPFSNGGPHSVDNLVPACARCNTLKQSKTAEEFAASISDVS